MAIKSNEPLTAGLRNWRLKCFYETFPASAGNVVQDLTLNFCSKNPPHCQAVNRYRSGYDSSAATK